MDCVDTAGFYAPIGVAVAGNTVYVANYKTPSVDVCKVVDGTLTSCIPTTDPVITSPSSIAIVGTKAYMPNNIESTMATCEINGAALTSCSTTAFSGLVLNEPSGILNIGGYIYVLSYQTSKVSICGINSASCTDYSDSLFLGPLRAAADSTGSIIYITNLIPNGSSKYTVVACDVTSSGATVGNCAVAWESLDLNPRGIFIKGSTVYLGITTGDVLVCSVVGKTFSSCVTNSGFAPIPYGISGNI